MLIQMKDFYEILTFSCCDSPSNIATPANSNNTYAHQRPAHVNYVRSKISCPLVCKDFINFCFTKFYTKELIK